MSYFPAGDDIIAREAYAGTDNIGRLRTNITRGAVQRIGLGSVLDTIGSFLTGATKAAINVYGGAQKSAVAAEAYKDVASQRASSSSLPGWVLPVGLGVVGVAAVALIAKRRKAK